MRTSPLGSDPEIESVTLASLVGIATAIENEAVRRYEQLEQTMRRRGEDETADAFRKMLEEEREHVEAIAQWAARLDVPVPQHDYRWDLPAELATSWDDIVGSALLTPYRAFALAVENEQRAFAFYAYLAARAADRTVALEAERLAAEELRHAALMRRWRREAYHRERRRNLAAHDDAASTPVSIASSPQAVQTFIDESLASIVASHRTIAAQLRATGDLESAVLLDELASTRVSESATRVSADAAAAPIDEATGSAPWLVAAQRPLEAYIETLESVIANAADETLERAERAATDAIGWMALLSLQIEHRLTRDAGGAVPAPRRRRR